jgi:hypothetical protein
VKDGTPTGKRRARRIFEQTPVRPSRCLGFVQICQDPLLRLAVENRRRKMGRERERTSAVKRCQTLSIGVSDRNGFWFRPLPMRIHSGRWWSCSSPIHAPNVTASSYPGSAKHVPLSVLSELPPLTSASSATRAVYPALLPHRPRRRTPKSYREESIVSYSRYARPFIQVQALQRRRHGSTPISSPPFRPRLLQANSSASRSHEPHNCMQTLRRSRARARPPPPRPTAHRLIRVRHAPALRARPFERQAHFI